MKINWNDKGEVKNKLSWLIQNWDRLPAQLRNRPDIRGAALFARLIEKEPQVGVEGIKRFIETKLPDDVRPVVSDYFQRYYGQQPVKQPELEVMQPVGQILQDVVRPPYQGAEVPPLSRRITTPPDETVAIHADVPPLIPPVSQPKPTPQPPSTILPPAEDIVRRTKQQVTRHPLLGYEVEPITEWEVKKARGEEPTPQDAFKIVEYVPKDKNLFLVDYGLTNFLDRTPLSALTKAIPMVPNMRESVIAYQLHPQAQTVAGKVVKKATDVLGGITGVLMVDAALGPIEALGASAGLSTGATVESLGKLLGSSNAVRVFKALHMGTKFANIGLGLRLTELAKMTPIERQAAIKRLPKDYAIDFLKGTALGAIVHSIPATYTREVWETAQKAGIEYQRPVLKVYDLSWPKAALAAAVMGGWTAAQGGDVYDVAVAATMAGLTSKLADEYAATNDLRIARELYKNRVAKVLKNGRFRFDPQTGEPDFRGVEFGKLSPKARAKALDFMADNAIKQIHQHLQRLAGDPGYKLIQSARMRASNYVTSESWRFNPDEFGWQGLDAYRGKPFAELPDQLKAEVINSYAARIAIPEAQRIGQVRLKALFPDETGIIQTTADILKRSYPSFRRIKVPSTTEILRQMERVTTEPPPKPQQMPEAKPEIPTAGTAAPATEPTPAPTPPSEPAPQMPTEMPVTAFYEPLESYDTSVAPEVSQKPQQAVVGGVENAEQEQKAGEIHEGVPQPEVPGETAPTGEEVPTIEGGEGVRESGQQETAPVEAKPKREASRKKQAEKISEAIAEAPIGIDYSINENLDEEVLNRFPTTGKSDVVVTPRNNKIPVRWAVVDLNDLVTSHDDNLRPVPEYPRELQPRMRERFLSGVEIENIARALEPRLLERSPYVVSGAPVIGTDGIVESGNARVLAIRRAMQKYPERYRLYREYIKKVAPQLGIPIEAIDKFKNPVLVRVRIADVNRPQFAEEANMPPMQAFSTTERALSDAKRMRARMLTRLVNVENPFADENLEFLTDFVRDVIPPHELNAYIDPKGNLSAEGVRRIKVALFAKAYGDPDIVMRAYESTDEGARNIYKALEQSAPSMAKLKAGAEEGLYHPLDLSKEIKDAVKAYIAIRNSKQTVRQYLSNQLFGGFLEPSTVILLQALDRYKRRPSQLVAILRDYAQTVERLGSPQETTMFDVKLPSKAEILLHAIQKHDPDFKPLVKVAAVKAPAPPEPEKEVKPKPTPRLPERTTPSAEPKEVKPTEPEKGGKPWLSDNPFTQEEIQTFNSLTHYPVDWNEDFRTEINRQIERVKEITGLEDEKEFPDELKKQIENYRKAYYNFIVKKAKARETAPPISVVGRSGYKGNVKKAEQIENRAFSILEKAERKLIKTAEKYYTPKVSDITLKDLKSSTLKKRFKAQSVFQRWHNRHKDGSGNIGIQINLSEGKQYLLRFHYTPDKKIYNISFGEAYAGGEPIEATDVNELLEKIASKLVKEGGVEKPAVKKPETTQLKYYETQLEDVKRGRRYRFTTSDTVVEGIVRGRRSGKLVIQSDDGEHLVPLHDIKRVEKPVKIEKTARKERPQSAVVRPEDIERMREQGAVKTTFGEKVLQALSVVSVNDNKLPASFLEKNKHLEPVFERLVSDGLLVFKDGYFSIPNLSAEQIQILVEQLENSDITVKNNLDDVIKTVESLFPSDDVTDLHNIKNLRPGSAASQPFVAVAKVLTPLLEWLGIKTTEKGQIGQALLDVFPENSGYFYETEPLKNQKAPLPEPERIGGEHPITDQQVEQLTNILSNATDRMLSWIKEAFAVDTSSSDWIGSLTKLEAELLIGVLDGNKSIIRQKGFIPGDPRLFNLYVRTAIKDPKFHRKTNKTLFGKVGEYLRPLLTWVYYKPHFAAPMAVMEDNYIRLIHSILDNDKKPVTIPTDEGDVELKPYRVIAKKFHKYVKPIPNDKLQKFSFSVFGILLDKGLVNYNAESDRWEYSPIPDAVIDEIRDAVGDKALPHILISLHLHENVVSESQLRKYLDYEQIKDFIDYYKKVAGWARQIMLRYGVEPRTRAYFRKLHPEVRQIKKFAQARRIDERRLLSFAQFGIWTPSWMVADKNAPVFLLSPETSLMNLIYTTARFDAFEDAYSIMPALLRLSDDSPQTKELIKNYIRENITGRTVFAEWIEESDKAAPGALEWLGNKGLRALRTGREWYYIMQTGINAWIVMKNLTQMSTNFSLLGVYALHGIRRLLTGNIPEAYKALFEKGGFGGVKEISGVFEEQGDVIKKIAGFLPAFRLWSDVDAANRLMAAGIIDYAQAHGYSHDETMRAIMAMQKLNQYLYLFADRFAFQSNRLGAMMYYLTSFLKWPLNFLQSDLYLVKKGLIVPVLLKHQFYMLTWMLIGLLIYGIGKLLGVEKHARLAKDIKEWMLPYYLAIERDPRTGRLRFKVHGQVSKFFRINWWPKYYGQILSGLVGLVGLVKGDKERFYRSLPGSVKRAYKALMGIESAITNNPYWTDPTYGPLHNFALIAEFFAPNRDVHEKYELMRDVMDESRRYIKMRQKIKKLGGEAAEAILRGDWETAQRKHNKAIKIFIQFFQDEKTKSLSERTGLFILGSNTPVYVVGPDGKLVLNAAFLAQEWPQIWDRAMWGPQPYIGAGKVKLWRVLSSAQGRQSELIRAMQYWDPEAARMLLGIMEGKNVRAKD